jgi:catechol-2,3-dioxygenase
VNVADITRSVQWYQEHLEARVLYRDETWALLEVGGVKMALTLPRQHPRHVAFDVGPQPSPEFLRSAKVHRDGSVSTYVLDPDGNAIEWIHYPPGTNPGVQAAGETPKSV